MSKQQKEAFFKIVVVLITTAVIGVGYLFVGSDSTAGFALLGLLGLAPLFVRTKGEGISVTEKEVEISRSSMVLAFWCTGMTCLALTLLAPYAYGEDGSIPVSTAQYVLIAACMLFVLVESSAVIYKSLHATQASNKT